MKLDASEQKIESSAGSAITHSLVSLDDFKEASRRNSAKPEPASEIISFNINDPYKDAKAPTESEFLLRFNARRKEEKGDGLGRHCIRVKNGKIEPVREFERLEEYANAKTAKEYALMQELRHYQIQCPDPPMHD